MTNLSTGPHQNRWSPALLCFFPRKFCAAGASFLSRLAGCIRRKRTHFIDGPGGWVFHARDTTMGLGQHLFPVHGLFTYAAKAYANLGGRCKASVQRPEG